MKMSESWLSCSVSCGTSLFGLLSGLSRQGLGPCMPYCTVSESCQDGILGIQIRIATRFSGLTAGGTGSTRRRLVLQPDRRKQNRRNLSLSSYGPREEHAWPGGAMGCSVFPEMSRGQTQQLRSMCYHRFLSGGESERARCRQTEQS